MKITVAVTAITVCLCAYPGAYAAHYKEGDKAMITAACATPEDALELGVASDRVAAEPADSNKRHDLIKAGLHLMQDKIINGECWSIASPVAGIVGKVLMTEMNTEVRPITLPSYPNKTWYVPFDLSSKESDS